MTQSGIAVDLDGDVLIVDDGRQMPYTASVTAHGTPQKISATPC